MQLLKESISSFHKIMVCLLQEEQDSKTMEQIKDVLPSVEQKMARNNVPFYSIRQRTLNEFLDEDWIQHSCEWVDSTDFWPKLPSLPNRSSQIFAQYFPSTCPNLTDHVSFNSCEMNELLNERYRCIFSSSSHFLFNVFDQIRIMPKPFFHQCDNYSSINNFKVSNFSNYHCYPPITHFVPALILKNINKFENINDAMKFPYHIRNNAISPIFLQNNLQGCAHTKNLKINKFVSLKPLNSINCKCCDLCNHCISKSFTKYICNCMVHHNSQKCDIDPLSINVSSSFLSLYSVIFSSTFEPTTFLISSSVCLPPSYHCCLERLLLDLLDPLASLSSKWCIAKEFLKPGVIKLLQSTLQSNDIKIKEVSCKLIASLCSFETFAQIASENGLLDDLKSLLKYDNFGVKLSAYRAYLNLRSYTTNKFEEELFDEMNRFDEYLLFSNSDGSLPLYTGGIYPAPDATNLSGTSGVDVLSKQEIYKPCTSKKSDELKSIEDDLFITSSKENHNVYNGFFSDELNAKNKVTSELMPIIEKKFKNMVDVVLIHGVLGGAPWTWRQHDDVRLDDNEDYTWCWPKDWLKQDFPNTRFRVLSVNYPEPGTVSSDRSLKNQGKLLKESLLKAGIGERPVIWITHSRGGLLLKSVFNSDGDEMVNHNKLIKKTAGVIFLSTPHKGAPLAPIVYALNPSLLELRGLNYKNQELAKLNTEFEKLYCKFNFPILSLVDKRSNKIFGINFRLVPEISADPGYGEVIKVDETHLDICKAKNRSSKLYKIILHFIEASLTGINSETSDD